MQPKFMPLHKKGGFLLSGSVMEMKKSSGASMSHSAGDLNLYRRDTGVFKGFWKASTYNVKKQKKNLDIERKKAYTVISYK